MIRRSTRTHADNRAGAAPALRISQTRTPRSQNRLSRRASIHAGSSRNARSSSRMPYVSSRLRSDPPPTCRAGGSLRPAARRWVCRDAGAGIKGLAVGACQTRRMPPYDTAVDAANAAKRTAALLRDARGVQRRLDKLAAGMADASAPAQRSLSEARDAVARVITELVHEEHAQRRATQQALRRRR